MNWNEEEPPLHFELVGLVFTIYPKLQIKLTLCIWITLLLILVIAQQWWQYEMTTADIPGGIIAGFLLAYLITVLVR